MPMSPQVVSKLQAYVKQDPSVIPIVRELKERRAYGVSDVYRIKLSLIKGGFEFNDLAIHQFFERLQAIGVGKLKIQQRPLHSVFTWTYSVHDVANAMLGIGSVTDEVLQLKQMLHTHTSVIGSPVTESSKTGLAASTTVLIPTPSGELATLKLNAPLDRQTALMLSNYLAKVAETLR